MGRSKILVRCSAWLYGLFIFRFLHGYFFAQQTIKYAYYYREYKILSCDTKWLKYLRWITVNFHCSD